MALFGLFGKKDDAAEVKKQITKATAKFGPPENRQGALTRLNEIRSPEAFAGMLQRFTVRVEPGITDDEEKQYVYECLVGAGSAAVDPIKAFIEKSEQPTWALKALDQLVPQAAVVDTILSALEREGAEYTRDPEKKVTLLRHLEPIEDERIAPRVVPYLGDMSEDVRVSAVAVLAARAQESTREPMIQALIQAQAESSERLKRAIAEALVKTGFSVKGQTPAVQAALPTGYTIDKDGHVKTR
jgi:HEAT repeat protein